MVGEGNNGPPGADPLPRVDPAATATNAAHGAKRVPTPAERDAARPTGPDTRTKQQLKQHLRAAKQAKDEATNTLAEAARAARENTDPARQAELDQTLADAEIKIAAARRQVDVAAHELVKRKDLRRLGVRPAIAETRQLAAQLGNDEHWLFGKLERGEELTPVEHAALAAEGFLRTEKISPGDQPVVPYDVQLAGFFVRVHGGRVGTLRGWLLDRNTRGVMVHMDTGEGKSLVDHMVNTYHAQLIRARHGAKAPDQGVHVYKIDQAQAAKDYLEGEALRDWFGLTGSLLDETIPSTGEHLNADIAYGTPRAYEELVLNNERRPDEEKIQRGFTNAIVDETDAILVDHARHPLRLAKAMKAQIEVELRYLARDLAHKLKRGDYSVRRGEITISDKQAEQIQQRLNEGEITLDEAQVEALQLTSGEEFWGGYASCYPTRYGPATN